MFRMEQTWRWFGAVDPVTLNDVKQTGATGIVSALHHLPHGEAWTVSEIQKHKEQIAASGLRWSVIESIPVHEDIKTRTGNYRKYLANYKTSVLNAAACGIKVVTYNFMPVNDWTRTSLNYRMADGSLALSFSWSQLALFDIFILSRKNAADSYPAAIVKQAEDLRKHLTTLEQEQLASVVMFGIPGERKLSVPEMRTAISRYQDIDANALRNNLVDFQHEISEVALNVGAVLAIHPDDPPYPIFGLPRVVSTIEDYRYFLGSVNNEANGICFCTGSLGASMVNDVAAMLQELGDRVHFVHLRNVRKDGEGNFFEDDHLAGDTDMYSIVKLLLEIQQRRRKSLPFRPDHGHQMLDDLQKVTNPGYSAIGRMRGLAELRGLEMGIARSLSI